MTEHQTETSSSSVLREGLRTLVNDLRDESRISKVESERYANAGNQEQRNRAIGLAAGYAEAADMLSAVLGDESLTEQTETSSDERREAERLLAAITPGDWEVAPHSDSDEVLNVVEGYEKVSNGARANWIAECDAQLDFDSDRDAQLELNASNAEFIAAAPRLLRALLSRESALQQRLDDANRALDRYGVTRDIGVPLSVAGRIHHFYKATESRESALQEEIRKAKAESDAREQVVENITYAIEGKPLPHPALAENSIVRRAARGLVALREEISRLTEENARLLGNTASGEVTAPPSTPKARICSCGYMAGWRMLLAQSVCTKCGRVEVDDRRTVVLEPDDDLSKLTTEIDLAISRDGASRYGAIYGALAGHTVSRLIGRTLRRDEATDPAIGTSRTTKANTPSLSSSPGVQDQTSTPNVTPVNGTLPHRYGYDARGDCFHCFKRYEDPIHKPSHEAQDATRST